MRRACVEAGGGCGRTSSRFCASSALNERGTGADMVRSRVGSGLWESALVEEMSAGCGGNLGFGFAIGFAPHHAMR